jgi:hypothetical protein
VIRIILILREMSVSSEPICRSTAMLLISTINGDLVRREELRSGRRAVLLGEQSQQAVADFELFNHGAEAGMGKTCQ